MNHRNPYVLIKMLLKLVTDSDAAFGIRILRRQPGFSPCWNGDFTVYIWGVRSRGDLSSWVKEDGNHAIYCNETPGPELYREYCDKLFVAFSKIVKFETVD